MRRKGVGMPPIRVVVGIMLLMIVAAALIAIFQPKVLTFSSTANKTIFSTLFDIGGLLP